MAVQVSAGYAAAFAADLGVSPERVLRMALQAPTYRNRLDRASAVADIQHDGLRFAVAAGAGDRAYELAADAYTLAELVTAPQHRYERVLRDAECQPCEISGSETQYEIDDEPLRTVFGTEEL